VDTSGTVGIAGEVAGTEADRTSVVVLRELREQRLRLKRLEMRRNQFESTLSVCHFVDL
jgi:hypothetical protein